MPGPNTSREYWTVDGVSLHTHAWSVTTLGGRYTTPGMRGDDSRHPYVPGDTWQPKTPAARTLNLPMWLAGKDKTTGAPAADPVLAWNDHWAYLRRLLWQPDREFILGRRWLRTHPDTGEPTIELALARGQLASELNPTMQHRARSTFELDIKLSDPFFYGDTIVSPNLRIGTAQSLRNPGDYAAYSRGANVTVEFTGPLGKPKVVNTSTTPHVMCALPSVAAGEVVTLNVSAFTAASVKGGVTSYRGAEVTNSGTRAWMAVRPGNNSMLLQADTGSGHAVVSFRPPYV